MLLPNNIQNIENKSDTTVYVAMSGGVDSSVSAALMAKAGFDVVGCFMTVWQPPFLDCSMEGERQDAMRVAAELDIPFQTIDLANVYKQRVVDYMIAEYKAGRTPNPDVMCNGEVKFGAFYNRAKEEGADYIATGHYARKRKIRNSELDIRNSQLIRGVDEHKDQSYFLWQLGQKQLQDTLFPVGHMEKSEVRETAKKFDIPVADKDDSQGLCFLGEVDMQDFLSEFIELKTGEVLNQSGDVIGKHQGAALYTIGQRRGFEVTDKRPDSGPWYVISKNIDRNTITVSENNSESGPVHNCKYLKLTDDNWITNEPQSECIYEAQVRYNQQPKRCRLEEVQNEWKVVFVDKLRGVATGQSCVVYQGDVCVGGGVIASVSDHN